MAKNVHKSSRFGTKKGGGAFIGEFTVVYKEKSILDYSQVEEDNPGLQQFKVLKLISY